MTRDKLSRDKIRTAVRLAEEAGFDLYDMSYGYDWMCNVKTIERFAALVAAHVREECAELCRAEANGRSPLAFDALHECADLIMEGSEK